jgi:hypothetical protein
MEVHRQKQGLYSNLRFSKRVASKQAEDTIHLQFENSDEFSSETELEEEEVFEITDHACSQEYLFSGFQLSHI